MILRRFFKKSIFYGQSCYKPISSLNRNYCQISNLKGRLFLSFECNICKTRTNKFISKHAYEKGMVICQCPECKNRHLIADNLGWFDSMKQPKGNLEQIAKEHGISFKKIEMDHLKDEETQWLLNGLEEYVEK